MGYTRPHKDVSRVLPTIQCDVPEDGRRSRHRTATARRRTSTTTRKGPTTTRPPTPRVEWPERCGDPTHIPTRVATSRQRVLEGNGRVLRIVTATSRASVIWTPTGSPSRTRGTGLCTCGPQKVPNFESFSLVNI